MGQYDPTPCPAVPTAAWLNAEYAAIETAFNSHLTSDFPEKCVHSVAIEKDRGQSSIMVGVEGGLPIAANVDRGHVVASKKSEVLKIYAICNACAGNPAAVLYRKRDGVEATVGQSIAFAAAHTAYLMTLLTTDLLPGDVLFMRIIAAAKSVSCPIVSVAVKSSHIP